MLKIFDLFSGCGGFRLAFENAGFNCTGFCEQDKHAVKLYKAFFNTENEVYFNDVRTILPEELPQFDILTAGFPCQSFSIAGKKLGLNDTRGSLLFEVLRILQKTKPKCVVLENVRDYVTLDEMGVNLHFVKENTVICPQSRSHEKFIHGIKVLIAKNFIDNLREETTKGQREKAEEGYYPGGCSAIGYKNVKNAEGKKIIVPDEERAFFVRRAFTLYNTGSISMRKLAQKLSMEGFTTKKGYPINHKSIEHILQNPIYMGEFYWAGKLYKGKHKPLIDKKLYNDVQKMFSNPLRSKERKEEATYTGIFRCGACGKMITVERQKGAHKSGDYIYYRCGNNECKQHYYINEIKLDKFIAETLKDININPEYEPLIQKNLIELHKIKTSEETVRLKRIHKEIDETKYLSNNLLDKYLEGKINDEIYQTKSKELTSRLEDLEVELGSLNKNQDNFEEYTKNLLELSKEAPHLYSRATKQNKKNLLKLVSLNPTIESGKPVIELHPVFQNIKKFSFGKLNVVGGT